MNARASAGLIARIWFLISENLWQFSMCKVHSRMGRRVLRQCVDDGLVSNNFNRATRGAGQSHN